MSKQSQNPNPARKNTGLYRYMNLWALYRIYETVGAGNHTMNWDFIDQVGIVFLCLLAVSFRSLRIWILAMLVVMIVDLRKMPFQFDSEYWCLLTDLTVVLSSVSTLGINRLMAVTVPLNEAEKWLIYCDARPTIANQMVVFYSAAMFWKLNWDFLDPHSSCAPIFIVALLDRFLPIPSSVVKPLVAMSPLMTILGEAFISISLVAHPSRGVLAAIVFHTAIAASPPPLNVATFSLMCVSRLICCLPVTTSTSSETPIWSWQLATLTVLLTAVAAKLANHGEFYDLAFPLFALVAPFVTAVVLAPADSTSTAPPQQSGTTKMKFLPVGLAIVYAYFLIPLGLQDQGQPHMFANMRLHGGSNHVLGVPTGLLQSTWDHEIVRIEASTSSLLNSIYPSEYTQLLSATSRDLLQTGGHTGRIFIPMLTLCTGSQPPFKGESSDFVKYTMPAIEFRRVLEVLRQTEVAEFEIEYTILAGHGNEQWRALAQGRRVRIREENGLSRNCRVLPSNHLCDENDLPNLPPLTFWARKLLLFQPYPIIPGDYKLHCFGP